MKKIFFIAIVITSIAISSCSNNNNFFADSYFKAVWLYNFKTFDNVDVVNKLLENNINAVFMSVDTGLIKTSNEYINKFKNFVSIAKQNNIKVHAMIYEDPFFTKIEKHEEALLQIDAILNYNEVNPEFSLDGIHLDVEPHALSEWQNADDFNDGVRESLIQSFLSLLNKTRLRLADSTLKLSAAITWWYDSKYREGVLPSGNTSLFLGILDFLVIMSYSKAISVYEQAKDELDIMPVVFGFYVPNYPDKALLEQDIQNVFNEAKINNNFMGSCIFKFSDYINY